MIETGAYWVGKSNGNHGNCTGVLCRCSVCGLAEQVLTMVQEQLKERSLKMSTLKPLGNDEWHTVLRAVGTNEIDRVIEDVRYQLKCEGEA